MSPGKKLISGIVLTVIVCVSAPATTLPDTVRGVKVSGGEQLSLVLTGAHTVWGCGDNSSYQLGIGNNHSQATLAQVLDGDMNSPTLYLEDISEIDAGWTHSLALDVNGFVWAWGQ
jgi:alpha-tubulin suppressor-like RCC1 family protein